MTLAFAVYSLLFLVLMKLKTYKTVWIMLKMLQLVFKCFWIGVGLILFFNLDTVNCTNTLLILSFVYYSLHTLLVFRVVS